MVIMIFTSVPDGNVYFNGMLYVRSRGLCVHGANPLWFVWFAVGVFYIKAFPPHLTRLRCVYVTNKINLVMCFICGPQIQNGIE